MDLLVNALTSFASEENRLTDETSKNSFGLSFSQVEKYFISLGTIDFPFNEENIQKPIYAAMTLIVQCINILSKDKSLDQNEVALREKSTQENLRYELLPSFALVLGRLNFHSKADLKDEDAKLGLRSIEDIAKDGDFRELIMARAGHTWLREKGLTPAVPSSREFNGLEARATSQPTTLFSAIFNRTNNPSQEKISSSQENANLTKLIKAVEIYIGSKTGKTGVDFDKYGGARKLHEMLTDYQQNPNMFLLLKLNLENELKTPSYNDMFKGTFSSTLEQYYKQALDLVKNKAALESKARSQVTPAK